MIKIYISDLHNSLADNLAGVCGSAALQADSGDPAAFGKPYVMVKRRVEDISRTHLGEDIDRGGEGGIIAPQQVDVETVKHRNIGGSGRPVALNDKPFGVIPEALQVVGLHTAEEKPCR